jgi:excisionase family DNA binding protein
MEDLLSIAEVARALRLNEQTLRNWIDDGTLPAVRIGRRVKIARAELESMLGTTAISPDDLLTVAEVASMLSLNQQTVRNAIDDGRLGAVRVGRRVRIRRADLHRYVQPVGAAELEPKLSADDFWSGVPLGANLV